MQLKSGNRLVYDHKRTLTSILSIVSFIIFMWCFFLYLTCFFLIINCNSFIIYMRGCISFIAKGVALIKDLCTFWNILTSTLVSRFPLLVVRHFHRVHVDTLWRSKPKEKYTETSTLVTNYETVTCIHTIPKIRSSVGCPKVWYFLGTKPY